MKSQMNIEKQKIAKDYYFVIKAMDSCKNKIQLKSCLQLIELFIDKNVSKTELTFSGIDKYNNVIARGKELRRYYKLKSNQI